MPASSPITFGKPISFNVEYFNFYSLYHHLLAIVGQPQRCLDDTARYSLIRAMLSDLYANGGGIFAKSASTPFSNSSQS